MPSRPAPGHPPGHVSQSDLDALRHPDPCSDSPYRSVYRDGSGWQARAFKRRIAPVRPSPREAAADVVRWWRDRYGDRWFEFFSYRQAAGWTLFRAGRGWWVVAYVGGDGVIMGDLGGSLVAATATGCGPFPTRPAAARAVRRWADATYGADAGAVLRRRWAGTHNPGRLSPVPA